ncbi:phosphatidylserine decarboxylase proenzyme 1, mitochondrial-like isoform X2 [Chenopodium quinoa]|uniref:phosphatidylserine decarboxylase proenzyme 1, mitochondrial-like isoform X2 n=1 Tax=Chenopodium quinoa TaxID=63459 RepID=UPI000B778984|nr:phosphatidylserine decarboxylase proenzyme 1, mitochondrial-like isoform X2 [Chenopodium quinoa]
MKFRVHRKFPVFDNIYRISSLKVLQCRNVNPFFINKLRSFSSSAKAALNDGHNSNSSSSNGNTFLLPGATVATILMLGALHARRLYDDKKVEEAKEKGFEPGFQPDAKASFLGLLPLRTISRMWGSLMSVELPVKMRPYVYRAWARAFHSNLEEVALPLEAYPSMRDFFARRLREGCRPIDNDSQCLISPVDGIVVRFGELKEPGAMIEQVKGFSYSVSALLGLNSFLPMVSGKDVAEKSSEVENVHRDQTKKSWWRVSFSSPKFQEPVPASPMKGLFYCVLYLSPGDYHRIHSPVDWNVLVRRHFSGRLYPVNERATRTIRNLYVENERVVLEGHWQQGYLALAAIGATNIGSIELYIEPELRTNRPRKKFLQSEPPEERVYEREGVGCMVKKGEEVAAFNTGSTVVLVFQAPVAKSTKDNTPSTDFRFNIKRGDRIHVGEALGRWNDAQKKE